MRFVLTDSTHANSYGFRTAIEGLNLDRFRNNPVMLYAHDDEKVIGRWEDIRVENGRLTAEAVFDTDDAEAALIAGKVERGFLKGCSIGMIVHEMREVNGELVATQSELLEASVCAVPADANAIALYDQNRRRLSAADVKEMLLKFDLNHDKMEKQNQQAEQLKIDELTQANQGLAAANESLTAELETAKATIADREGHIEKLEAQIAQMEQERIESYLKTAAADGRIEQSEIEHFTKLAEADFDAVKAILDSRSNKPQTRLAAVTAGAKAEVSAAVWDKMDREGKLAELKATDRARFEELYKAKFGAEYKG